MYQYRQQASSSTVSAQSWGQEYKAGESGDAPNLRCRHSGELDVNPPPPQWTGACIPKQVNHSVPDEHDDRSSTHHQSPTSHQLSNTSQRTSNTPKSVINFVSLCPLGQGRSIYVHEGMWAGLAGPEGRPKGPPPPSSSQTASAVQ